MSESKPHAGPLRWFQNSFFAGIVIVLPLAVTVWLVAAFVQLVDHNVLPLLPEPFKTTASQVPGAGIMIAVTLLTVIGALAGNFIGRAIVRELDGFLARLPIIRSVYGGSKQVFKQIAEPEQRSFKDAVLIQFPQKGYWSIGFITNATPDQLPEGYVAVYMPQAPIPTSGLLIFAPRSELVPLACSAEEALKRVISLNAGQTPAVTPPETPGV